MSTAKRWKTRGGIIVVSKTRPTDTGGFFKVHCWREDTGGYHGLLRVDRLMPLRALGGVR